MSDEPAPVRLRVVHGGAPSAEELAALAVVSAIVAARRAGRKAGAGDRLGRRLRQAALRQPLLPGPGAWAASGRRADLRTRAGG